MLPYKRRRQAHADTLGRQRYCSNCNRISPMGGYCTQCLVIVTAAECGDMPLPALQDSFHHHQRR
jgi:hypothetical protein